MESAIARYIAEQLGQSLATITALHADKFYRDTAERVAALFIETLMRGNTLLFAGNGGSAADSQHVAGEYVSRFHYDRPGLSAIALTTDTSILTAIGNDYGYEYVFSRQIEAIGRKGDVFVAITTSGNSPNILAGIEAAKKKGITTVGMTGRTGGKMKAMCDLCLCVPSDSVPRIQEGHLATHHFLCGVVEAIVFPKPA